MVRNSRVTDYSGFVTACSARQALVGWHSPVRLHLGRRFRLLKSRWTRLFCGHLRCRALNTLSCTHRRLAGSATCGPFAKRPGTVLTAAWLAAVPSTSRAIESGSATTESVKSAAEEIGNTAAQAATTNNVDWSSQLTNWLAAIDAVLLVSATILTIIVTVRDWRRRSAKKEQESKSKDSGASKNAREGDRLKAAANAPPGKLNRYQRRELRKRRNQDDSSL
jgi:hypothetical protein